MALEQFLKQFGAKESDIINFSEEESIIKVQQNGDTLRYVKQQTEGICKLAVGQDGDALQFVQQQTEEICKLAVQQNGHALRFVDKNIFKNDYIKSEGETK